MADRRGVMLAHAKAVALVCAVMLMTFAVAAGVLNAVGRASTAVSGFVASPAIVDCTAIPNRLAAIRKDAEDALILDAISFDGARR